MTKSSAKKTAVVGLGQTGVSCVKFLLGKGEKVVAIDTRDQPPGLVEFKRRFPNVEVYLGGLPEEVLLAVDEIVVSPGVSIQDGVLQRISNSGEVLIGDVELFCREVTAPVVAITGSNGKSTVTDLLGKMAKHDKVDVQVGGNIGIPVLDLLDLPSASLYVLELSSFQLETTHSLKAKAAVILNISADHMDRYKSFADYCAAKHRVYRGAETVIFNRDAGPTKRQFETGSNDTGLASKVHEISFGLNAAPVNHFGVADENQERFLVLGKKPMLAVRELKIRGSHNQANALAALALGETVGISQAAMIEVLQNYPGLPHRCQWVGTSNCVDWYNDSKGTNVGATIAALEGLRDFTSDSNTELAPTTLLIAGGVGKGADFSPLKNAVHACAQSVVLFGEDKHTIAKALAPEVMADLVDTLDEAVALAVAYLSESSDKYRTVLFSPACASFDSYKNYEERGEHFCQLVDSLVFNRASRS